MSNTITVNDDFSSHIVSEDGEFEFFMPNYDIETDVPFTSADQVRAKAEDLWGKYPNIWSAFVSAEDRAAKLNEQLAANNRAKRNQLLADSDWTQMNDSPLSNEDKTSWATYRQSLRDITADESWPDVTFPATP